MAGGFCVRQEATVRLRTSTSSCLLLLLFLGLLFLLRRLLCRLLGGLLACLLGLLLRVFLGRSLLCRCFLHGLLGGFLLRLLLFDRGHGGRGWSRWRDGAHRLGHRVGVGLLVVHGVPHRLLPLVTITGFQKLSKRAPQLARAKLGVGGQRALAPVPVID